MARIFSQRPLRILSVLGAKFCLLLWWNFVSSSVDRMEAAKAEWRAGRMELPPGDDHEFIPLPDEPLPHPTDPV
ncbi:MAG TPA: hypothetical protein VG274_12885 [Rhizomicrobium sp.]|nr:hypothetical protein [Rhizomicrobium sp.]